MRAYEKGFIKDAVKLSNKIGVSKTSEHLGVPIGTLKGWRRNANYTQIKYHMLSKLLYALRKRIKN